MMLKKTGRFFTRGFTLIELLVVIAIIGLLSSIILASLKKAKDSATDATIMEHLHQIDLALNQYYYDKGDYVPVDTGTNFGFELVSQLQTTLLNKKYISSIIPGSDIASALYVHACSVPPDVSTPCSVPGQTTNDGLLLAPQGACDPARKPIAAVLFQLQSGPSKNYIIWQSNPTYNAICYYAK